MVIRIMGMPLYIFCTLDGHSSVSLFVPIPDFDPLIFAACLYDSSLTTHNDTRPSLMLRV